MLHPFKNMTTRYHRYMTYLGRQRAREVLLQTSDRMLEDTGISRELLEKGVSAWPWRSTSHMPQKQSIAYKTRQAVEELSAYSDSELHDLGITRGTITEAVLNGRQGIERKEEKRAA